MGSGKPPAFQFYGKDFMSGTDTMTVAEVGIYIRLLCSSWDNGPLPKEPSRLAIVAKTTIRDFIKAWPAVRVKWTETDAGYINERLEEQRQSQIEFAERQAERGRKSGESRRAKSERRFEPDANAGSPVVPTAHERESNSSVSDLQSADHDPNTDRSDRVTHARAADAPHWRPAGPRRADPRLRDLGYHDRHCALWGRPACDAGVCIPKYEWPKWERRKSVEQLAAFVSAWVGRANTAGDAPEKFWPWAFEQHFGASVTASPRGDKTTRAIDALDEARALVGTDRKAVTDGRP